MELAQSLFVALLLAAALSHAAHAAPQQRQRGGGAGNNLAQIGSGDISRFLGDTNLVRKQINCVKGTGPCNQLGSQIKQAIPEVLNNRCVRCNASQAANARKLINYIRANYPRDYQAITSLYLRTG